MKWPGFFGQICGLAKMHSGWVSCRLGYLSWLKVCVVGRPFIKRGGWSLGVAKSDPVVDDAFGLEAVLQFAQVGGLLLEGSPQSFNEDVVEIPPTTIHRDFDLGICQPSDPGGARELRSLIRIHDLRLAIVGKGLTQGFDTKAGVQRI
jgi:hypothetical protein